MRIYDAQKKLSANFWLIIRIKVPYNNIYSWFNKITNKKSDDSEILKKDDLYKWGIMKSLEYTRISWGQ